MLKASREVKYRSGKSTARYGKKGGSFPNPVVIDDSAEARAIGYVTDSRYKHHILALTMMLLYALEGNVDSPLVPRRYCQLWRAVRVTQQPV